MNRDEIIRAAEEAFCKWWEETEGCGRSTDTEITAKSAWLEATRQAYEELIHLLEFHSDETREGLIEGMKRELAKLHAPTEWSE